MVFCFVFLCYIVRMEKLNLNDPKIINIVIGVIAAVLIVGGFFYYKSIKNPDIEEKTTGLPESTENNGAAGGEEALEPSSSGANDPQIRIVAPPEKAKFDTAMSNGNKAFLSGNYSQAIVYYSEALTYNKTDVVHARLFAAYSAQNDTIKAQTAIDTAISLNPKYTDYWNYKLIFMDQKTDASYSDLKKIYTEALSKVDSKNKVNLVTHFAEIAESNGQKSEAISLWEYAKNLYPANTALYQAEIDRLRAL